MKKNYILSFYLMSFKNGQNQWSALETATGPKKGFQSLLWSLKLYLSLGDDMRLQTEITVRLVLFCHTTYSISYLLSVRSLQVYPLMPTRDLSVSQIRNRRHDHS